jgi:hypothetical protein
MSASPPGLAGGSVRVCSRSGSSRAARAGITSSGQQLVCCAGLRYLGWGRRWRAPAGGSSLHSIVSTSLFATFSSTIAFSHIVTAAPPTGPLHALSLADLRCCLPHTVARRTETRAEPSRSLPWWWCCAGARKPQQGQFHSAPSRSRCFHRAIELGVRRTPKYVNDPAVVCRQYTQNSQPPPRPPGCRAHACAW